MQIEVKHAKKRASSYFKKQNRFICKLVFFLYENEFRTTSFLGCPSMRGSLSLLLAKYYVHMYFSYVGMSGYVQKKKKLELT